MDVLFSAFQAVAMLLFIGVIGAWMITRKMVKENFFSLLSPLALEIALPALIFTNIINNFNPYLKTHWWKLPFWWGFFTVIAFTVTLIGIIFAKKENKREFGISLFYQNGIFFPLAILAGMFGRNSEYIVDLFLFMIFYASFFFSTSFLFFSKKGKIEWKKIFHPVFIVTVLAVILKLTGFNAYIPSFIISAIEMVGAMSIPLLMIILGGNILTDFRKIGKLYVGEIVKFLIFKNLIVPFVILGLIILIRPSYNIALILMIESAVPPVTAIPLVTDRNGGNRTIVNQFLLSSFLFSLISIPLMMYLFNRLT
ncbi:AEC family transporter [candidate division WOR-3 bacterium]|nr:AEC family transporter [candidate division WOR-3 bacterium]